MAELNDIIQQITTDTGVSASDATRWVNAVTNAIVEILTTGKSVTVPGLGTFTVTGSQRLSAFSLLIKEDSLGIPGIEEPEKIPLIRFIVDEKLKKTIEKNG